MGAQVAPSQDTQAKSAFFKEVASRAARARDPLLAQDDYEPIQATAGPTRTRPSSGSNAATDAVTDAVTGEAGDASATGTPATRTVPEASTAAAIASLDSHAAKDPWEFTIAGRGGNDRRFKDGSGALSATLGYYLTDVIEIGARQDLLFIEGSPDSWNGASRGFFDFHFPVWGFRPFIGASVGAVYGDSIQDQMMAGLEGGAKVDLREGAFLFLMGEYQWFFDSGDEFSDNFDDGGFVYTVGMGVRF